MFSLLGWLTPTGGAASEFRRTDGPFHTENGIILTDLANILPHLSRCIYWLDDGQPLHTLQVTYNKQLAGDLRLIHGIFSIAPAAFPVHACTTRGEEIFLRLCAQRNRLAGDIL
jgi:hypothetical protein